MSLRGYRTHQRSERTKRFEDVENVQHTKSSARCREGWEVLILGLKSISSEGAKTGLELIERWNSRGLMVGCDHLGKRSHSGYLRYSFSRPRATDEPLLFK